MGDLPDLLAVEGDGQEQVRTEKQGQERVLRAGRNPAQDGNLERHGVTAQIVGEYALHLGAQEQEAQRVQELPVGGDGQAEGLPLQTVEALGTPKRIEHLQVPAQPGAGVKPVAGKPRRLVRVDPFQKPVQHERDNHVRAFAVEGDKLVAYQRADIAHTPHVEPEKREPRGPVGDDATRYGEGNVPDQCGPRVHGGGEAALGNARGQIGYVDPDRPDPAPFGQGGVQLLAEEVGNLPVVAPEGEQRDLPVRGEKTQGESDQRDAQEKRLFVSGKRPFCPQGQSPRLELRLVIV